MTIKVGVQSETEVTWRNNFTCMYPNLKWQHSHAKFKLQRGLFSQLIYDYMDMVRSDTTLGNRLPLQQRRTSLTVSNEGVIPKAFVRGSITLWRFSSLSQFRAPVHILRVELRNYRTVEGNYKFGPRVSVFAWFLWQSRKGNMHFTSLFRP